MEKLVGLPGRYLVFHQLVPDECVRHFPQLCPLTMLRSKQDKPVGHIAPLRPFEPGIKMIRKRQVRFGLGHPLIEGATTWKSKTNKQSLLSDRAAVSKRSMRLSRTIRASVTNNSLSDFSVKT